MNNKIINVSDNSNIEIGEDSVELLMHAVCRSIECDDFRANKCRMKMFITAIDGGEWQWSQTWVTPSKFLLHLVKSGGNPSEEAMALFNDIKEKWACLGADASCRCDFLDEMKKLKAAVEKETDKTSI